ncbi:MAG: repair protein RecN [Bacteroidota bacterium]|jgi:DNA repair protein RecN (Recombination protein N)
MIHKLTVKNFVLIDALEIDFQRGFTAITGETGSGKSILLGALGLLKGDRADFSLIGPDGNKSVVEGVFSMDEIALNFLATLDLEPWTELVVRREIQKDGRSRAFVNDTPIGVQDLKVLMSRMLVIHSQYNTLELKDKDYQLSILDALSGTLDSAKDYRSRYAKFQSLGRRLQVLQDQQRELLNKQDYESFLLEELSALNLREIDYDNLAQELSRHEQKRELLEILEGLVQFSEGDAQNHLQGYRAKLQKMSGNDPGFTGLLEQLNQLVALMKELGFEASSKTEDLMSNSLDATEVLSKVDEYNRLLNKHRVTDQSSLLNILEELASHSQTLSQWTKEISLLESQIVEEEQALEAAAKTLNASRREKALLLSEELKEGLVGLKLKDAQIQFVLTDTDTLNERGMIDLDILFSANKGMELTPIHKAASGGELSRVMLLLQQRISGQMDLPCILFDEIDTGVSGDVAERMGKLLRTMGENRQLLAITHLPQVAAKAQGHLKVAKEDRSDRTITSVRSLEDEERIIELARLLSGEEIRPEAVQQAHSLRTS